MQAVEVERESPQPLGGVTRDPLGDANAAVAGLVAENDPVVVDVDAAVAGAGEEGFVRRPIRCGRCG
jgi:hypothetical protein